METSTDFRKWSGQCENSAGIKLFYVDELEWAPPSPDKEGGPRPMGVFAKMLRGDWVAEMIMAMLKDPDVILSLGQVHLAWKQGCRSFVQLFGVSCN